MSCHYVESRTCKDELGYLAEEISKQSVAGMTWFLLLPVVKCERRERNRGKNVKQKGNRT